MKSSIGPNPPLHRRFNENESREHICNRYSTLRNILAKQVEVLQQNESFRDRCNYYYGKGYKDWVILSAIHNCMMNWKAGELGLTFLEADQELFHDLTNQIKDAVYPVDRFLGEDFDNAIKIYCFTCLRTYGFVLRLGAITPEIAENIEKFLRERMRHFELDLPHNPIFGEPLGDWPEI